MTKAEEHELRSMGFSEEEIQEMKAARKAAKADMKNKTDKDAKKSSTND